MRETRDIAHGYWNPPASVVNSLFDFDYYYWVCTVKSEYYFRRISSVFRNYRRHTWLCLDDDWYRQSLRNTTITSEIVNLFAAILTTGTSMPQKH